MIVGNDTIYTFQKFGYSAYFIKQSSIGSPLWVKTFKGPNISGEGHDVALDRFGNVYFTGSFWDTAIFNQQDTLIAKSKSDIFLAKYDTSGAFKWAISESGNNEDVGYSLSTYDSFVYLGGEKGSGGAFLAKYDSSGNLKWKNSGKSGEIKGISQDTSGNIYTTGSFRNKLKFGQDSVNSFGAQDIWNGKFNSNGKVQWLTHFGSNSTDEGKALTVKENGNFFNTGYFSDNAVFGNDTFLVNTGFQNAYIASFNENGKLNWLNQFKGGSDGRALSIYKDRFIYATGRYASSDLIIGKDTLLKKGGNDIFITKLNQKGVPLYSFGTGSVNADQGNGLSVDGQGNAYITGDFKIYSIWSI